MEQATEPSLVESGPPGVGRLEPAPQSSMRIPCAVHQPYLEIDGFAYVDGRSSSDEEEWLVGKLATVNSDFRG